MVVGLGYNFGVEVPMINETAMTYLLKRGFRMDSLLPAGCVNRPFGQLENYIIISPPFFL